MIPDQVERRRNARIDLRMMGRVRERRAASRKPAFAHAGERRLHR
jgi:hypothetical protein